MNETASHAPERVGLRIGLLGGSFNPAHEGHLHIAHMCLKALALDGVWWLVSPQNPLKETAGMAPLETRLEAARRLVEDADEKRILVTDIERDLGTQFTIDTMQALRKRFPQTQFVWLMGADNMIQLPRWDRWQALIEEMPIAVYPRPGFTSEARHSEAASLLARFILKPDAASQLASTPPPALILLDGPEHPASSTAIRTGKQAGKQD